MEEKELFKKIENESENNVPDVYDKILFAAHAEGLLDNGDTEVYSDGETVALGGVNKKAIAVTTLAALAAVSLAIALPIALSSKPDSGLDIPPFGNGGDKIVADIDLGDDYAYGAVTTARLAESFFNTPATAKATAKRSVSENDFQEFGTYFSALDCYLGKDQLSLGSAQAGDYQKSITISGRRTNGKKFDYAMQYTEYKLVKNDYVSGSPVEYYLEGMINVSGGGFALIGSRTLASDAEGAEETALDLYAYPNEKDKTTYARMQLEYVEIDGVTVKSYSYTIVKGDSTVSEAVAYKPADADLVINIKDGKTDKGNFTVTGETEDGNGYNVNYVLGAEEGNFKVTFDDNGLKYEFPDPEEENPYLGYRDNGNGTYSVTTYDKTAEDLPETLVIPSTYKGKPIVSIGNGAFKYSAFKKVIIGDGIIKVGDEAFSHSSIEEIEFPSTLTVIGDSAFGWCSQLKELNLPSSLKTIESVAFASCTSLTEVTIPNGVESIGYIAFYYCSNLTSVKLPASLKLLRGSAFTSCSKLESITVDAANPLYHSAGNCVIETKNKVLVVGCPTSVIPTDGSVTELGYYSFYDTGITELNLPSSITVIGERALGQNNFTSLNLPEGLQRIGKEAFTECHQMTEVILPSTLKEIGELAFYNCALLERVNIPASVERIVGGAFAACYRLEDLTVDVNNPVYHSAGGCVIDTENKILVEICPNCQIPANGSVEVIGDYAFYHYGNPFDDIEITIPSSVKIIGNHAFDGSFIKKVVMEGVTYIYDYAFYECYDLETVEIGDSLIAIFRSAFEKCGSLKNVTLPARITEGDQYGAYIESQAFADCTAIESIIIPEGITKVDYEAFRGCINLTTVTIPKTVKQIGDAAFAGCNALTTVNFGGTMEEWQNIDKQQDTWSYTDGFTVVCTDGTLDKDGTQIN